MIVTMPLSFNNGNFVLEGAPPVPVHVFRLLETLPNLSDLNFEDLTARVRLQDLHLFPKVAQRTALSHLSFSLEYGSVANGLPIAGPEGLKSISVEWHVSDGPDGPGSSLSHLYEFLRPSLGTLVHLKLHDYPILDFQVFGPPCTSLHTFEYTTYSRSSKVLEAVAKMFPNITNLKMVFLACGWMVCQICYLLGQRC